MSSPFASSNFCALITGGRSAPSDGGEKITMVSFSSVWAWHGVAAATATNTAAARERSFEPHGYHRFLHLNFAVLVAARAAAQATPHRRATVIAH